MLDYPPCYLLKGDLFFSYIKWTVQGEVLLLPLVQLLRKLKKKSYGERDHTEKSF